MAEFQPEILGILTGMPRLTGPVPLRAWHGYQVTADAERHCREFERITGSVSLQFNWTNKDDIDRAVDRALVADASLCLIVQPHVPASDADDVALKIEQYEARWHEILGWVDGRVSINSVYTDLEGFPYNWNRDPQTGRPPAEAIRHNRLVSEYNHAVYEIARAHLPDDVLVHSYDHLAVSRNRSDMHGGEWVSPYSQPYDPCDGGFAVNWYAPTEHAGRELWALDQTIDSAKRWGINQGYLWIMAGSQKLSWQNPGCDIFPSMGQDVSAVPYDPKISRDRGGYFSGKGWSTSPDRNGRFPDFNRIKSLILWPGFYRAGLEITHGVHVCALLDGLAGRPFDEEYRKIQTKHWREWEVRL